MRNEALETVDDDEAVVEEVRARDLDSVDEDLFLLVGGDGQAAVWSQCLDFGSENEGFQEVDGVKARERELLEEEREGARGTGEEGGVGGGKHGEGSGGGKVGGCGGGGEFLEAECGENGSEERGGIGVSWRLEWVRGRREGRGGAAVCGGGGG